MVREDRLDIDPNVWTPQHTALLKTVSQQPEVARVFVNAAIKKALCREAGADRGWLTKVRPIFGHDYHFHIRLACPRGRRGLRRPGAAAGRRRLRRRARAVVHAGDAASEARHRRASR